MTRMPVNRSLGQIRLYFFEKIIQIEESDESFFIIKSIFPPKISNYLSLIDRHLTQCWLWIWPENLSTDLEFFV